MPIYMDVHIVPGVKAKDVAEVITRFAKHGGKVIDSSPSYGNAESLIG